MQAINVLAQTRIVKFEAKVKTIRWILNFGKIPNLCMVKKVDTYQNFATQVINKDAAPQKYSFYLMLEVAISIGI